MLALISSIPTTVRAGFDVQDLPPRASTVSEDTLENVFGGVKCGGTGAFCFNTTDCCKGLKCKGILRRGCRK
jgi:hypothetical protein